jgi:hypothetical protein
MMLVSEHAGVAGEDVRRVVGYGHVGDGNLHLNITTPQHSKVAQEACYEFFPASIHL